MAKACIKSKILPHNYPTIYPTIRPTIYSVAIKNIKKYTISYRLCIKSCIMAGAKWFEHPNDGVRVRCLTAWRIPKKYLLRRYFIKLYRFLQAFYTRFINIFCFSTKKEPHSLFSFLSIFYDRIKRSFLCYSLPLSANGFFQMQRNVAYARVSAFP